MNYGPKIVTNGLVLALDAADKKSYSGSGTTWNDLTQNRNNFTLYNSPTFANTYGGELRFNLTNYARNRNNTIINSIAANGTVEIWCRTYDGTFGNQAYGRLISVANDTGTGSDTTSTQGSNNDYSNFFAFARNAGTEYLNLWYKNNPAPFGATNTYNTNLYVQLIFNWSTSGSNMTFNHYINASSVASNTYTQSAYTGANNITLAMNSNGAVSAMAEPIKAAYSIVRLYNRTLSASEIRQNFNTQRGRFGI